MEDHSLNVYWRNYLATRFRAFRNLLQIIGYHTGAQLEERFRDCDTVEKFALLWGEEISQGERTGSLKRDAEPWIIQVEGGDTIDVRFVASDGTDSKLKTADIFRPLMSFLGQAAGLPPGEEGEELLWQRTQVIRGKRLILVSQAELEGAAHNVIVERNMFLEHPIRFFTIEELQTDPTKHKTGPKSMTVLSPSELRQFINNQIGLPYGTTRVVPDFAERLKNTPDTNARINFLNEADEEVLKRIPTINTSDPWVKWRGFKAGDVLRIERRFGKSKITYRRVVYIEPVPTKPPKAVVAVTKN